MKVVEVGMEVVEGGKVVDWWTRWWVELGGGNLKEGAVVD